MAIVERKTNAPIRSVGFEYNKPIASSDLNESQSLIINSVAGFLNGKLTAGTAKISIDEFTDSKPGIILTGIKFLVVDSSSNVFMGNINPSVKITYPGTPAAGSKYDLYAYWRSVELTPSSTVYTNGIRTNGSQTSIVESTTPNNIIDTTINEEVSNRKSLELTFVAVAQNASAPVLSGWSTAVKISTITLKSDKSTLLDNVVPASDIDGHIADPMPHVFLDGTSLYKYGFSVSNNHMNFNYEEV